MANNIVLSAGVRQNLLSLQTIADLTSITQARLATGKKVNSPIDSPVSYFTAQRLQSRSGDLGALLDAMSNAIQTVAAANTGITSIITTVQSMQSTLMQARQDSSWASNSYTVDAAAIGTGVAKTLDFAGGQITGTVSIALNTIGTNGTATSQTTAAPFAPPAAAAASTVTGAAFSSATAANLITITYTPTTSSGSLYTNGSTATYSLAVSLTTNETTLTQAVDKINAAILLDSTLNGKIQATDSGGALRITSIGNVDANVTATQGGTGALNAATTVAGSDGLTAFTVNGVAVSLTTATGANLAAAINTINLQLLGASSAFEAYDAGGGMLGIRERVAQGAALTIAGPDAGLFAAVTAGTAATNSLVNDVDALVNLINSHAGLMGKVKASNDAGKLRVQNYSTTNLTLTGANSTTIDGNNLNTSTVIGNQVRKGLVVQYNVLLDQLDKFSADASYNGINLLQGDVLKVIFNEQSTSTLDVAARDVAGNLITVNSTNLGITQLQNSQLDLNSNIDTILNNLAQSLQLARSQASSFGSSLSIVQNRQDFTKTLISTLLTGADNLVVADTNEEGANMLALQTRQQLSITALSLANQSNQSVLRLFG